MSEEGTLQLVAQALGNPLLFEDLKQGFAVHAEPSDWLKFSELIRNMARVTALDDAAKYLESVSQDSSIVRFLARNIRELDKTDCFSNKGESHE